MRLDLLLTIDVGTTGVKAALCDRDGLRTSATVPYPTARPQPGWAEQELGDILSAAMSAARTVLDRRGSASIACIGLTGHMNGCLPLDESGRALRPHIIHADMRGEERMAELSAAIDPLAYYRLTGSRLSCHASLPKILWLRAHERDVYERAAHFVNTKDAVYGYLTNIHGRTDPSDASLAGAIDIRKGCWAQDLLAALRVPVRKMGEIRPSTDASAGLCAAAAKALNLPQGTPVAIGGGDGACASRGAGLTRPGRAYGNIGSTAWISALSERAPDDPHMRVFSYFDMDGRQVTVCGTMQSGAASISWAVRALAAGMSVQQAEDLARKSPPGARGALFAPYLQGERTPHWDALATGGFAGLRMDHAREDLLRAVWEGVAFALADCAAAVADVSGPIAGLTLVGGGARSHILPPALAALLHAPVARHESPGEGTSLGAAMAAAVAVGYCRDWQEAAAMARTQEATPPDPALEEAYGRAYERFRALYPALTPFRLAQGDA